MFPSRLLPPNFVYSVPVGIFVLLLVLSSVLPVVYYSRKALLPVTGVDGSSVISVAELYFKEYWDRFCLRRLLSSLFRTLRFRKRSF